MLATADQSLSLQQAAGDKRINFDTTKFIYIGNPNVENNTTAAWHTSGIKTIDDAKRREVTVGATGGSTSSQYPKAMNALIGTKFKIVLGLSRRQRRQPGAGARRGGCPRLEQLDLVEGDPARTGSPRRRSTFSFRSGWPRRPTCRTCRC